MQLILCVVNVLMSFLLLFPFMYPFPFPFPWSNFGLLLISGMNNILTLTLLLYATKRLKKCQTKMSTYKCLESHISVRLVTQHQCHSSEIPRTQSREYGICTALLICSFIMRSKHCQMLLLMTKSLLFHECWWHTLISFWWCLQACSHVTCFPFPGSDKIFIISTIQSRTALSQLCKKPLEHPHAALDGNVEFKHFQEPF